MPQRVARLTPIALKAISGVNVSNVPLTTGATLYNQCAAWPIAEQALFSVFLPPKRLSLLRCGPMDRAQ